MVSSDMLRHIDLAAPHAQPLRWTQAEEAGNQVGGFGRQVARDAILAVLYPLEGRHLLLRHKRRLAVQHLEGEHAESPPVDGMVVALMGEHLGRDVVRRATKRPRAIGHLLGKAKIDEL